MIILEHLSKSFGRKQILNDVNVGIRAGSIVGLIGPSGGGKSTILKILAGVIQPDSGGFQIDICNKDEIGLMFQEGALFDSLTVYDNIAFPLVHGEVPTTCLPDKQFRWVHAKVQEILARVGLSSASNKYPGQLSGGMRRRISLARALVPRPRLLLLDDPTAGLDPIASNIIMQLIADVHKEYRPTIVVVSHDLRRLFPHVEEVCALFDGKISFQGTVTEMQHCCSADISRFVQARYAAEPEPQPIT